MHVDCCIVDLLAAECLFVYSCGYDDVECECLRDGVCVCYVVFLVE